MLRIHLILMRIRIRILDPHWKKTDPDPGHYFKIYWIFLTKIIFKFFKYFFAYFYPKTLWTIQKWGNFYLSFFKSSDFGSKSKKVFFCSFWLIFYPLNPDPWICIFLRIRIKESKILRIHRIRIISAGIMEVGLP